MRERLSEEAEGGDIKAACASAERARVDCVLVATLEGLVVGFDAFSSELETAVNEVLLSGTSRADDAFFAVDECAS